MSARSNDGPFLGLTNTLSENYVRTAKRRADGPDGPGGRPGLLSLYRACLVNAESLVDEAKVLLAHHRAARAFALAYTAYEEVGKAMLVADAYCDRVATSELHAAFASHGVKAGYLQRSVRVDLDRASGWPGEGTIEYSVDSVGFRKRTAAMYVDFGTEYAPCIPDTAISTEDASARINLVDSHLHDISMAEYNGEQIGTYGLWK